MRILPIALCLVALPAFAADPPKADEPTKKVEKERPAAKRAMAWSEKARAGKDIYATFETTAGNIVVRLFPKDAPRTVENFVALAAGEKEWTDPATGQKVKKPLYDNTKFHRVLPTFMIQGGDPAGTGKGGPGYTFEDEFQSGRKFDKPGLLAMANSGPNTNGSQFFITEVKTDWLNGRHTIFGEVLAGLDLVPKIVALGSGNVTIKRVALADVAPAK